MNEQIKRELAFHSRLKKQRKARVIEIDTHEDLDRLTELLLTGMGYTVVRRLLPLGDYQWGSPLGQVIVERKTPADARDVERLSKQVVRLRDASSHGGCFPILLIDHREEYNTGRYTPKYQPWSDSDFDNVLLSIGGRVRIAHCQQGQLAHRLDSLYRWSMKSSHGLLDTEV
ncbi:hypothetical protein LCGC14_2740850 [marine sediment metagenome]|uniref:ERCC4 domain-containing protein n=1 Tax=marine sediment metagenome TaxID=412755 RepID=A0A0F8Z4F3_9ZZZZ